MKEALLKKRHGIPAALLLALLAGTAMVSGTALAWHTFATVHSETTVQEPLSTTDGTEFSAKMYPGETKTWSFDIVNSAKVVYTVKADLTYSAPSGVEIIDFSADDGDETNDLLDDGTAEFDVPAKSAGTRGRITCSVTISAATDATPGNVTVSLDISRK